MSQTIRLALGYRAFVTLKLNIGWGEKTLLLPREAMLISISQRKWC